MKTLGGSGPAAAGSRDDKECPESFRGKNRKHRAAERTIHHGALIGLVAFGSAALLAAEESKDPEQPYRIVIDAVARGVPGVQASVRQGKSRWTGTAGVASVEQSTAMNLKHRFRLASITKLMTYATVMELVKAGRFQLSDRASTVLPPGALDGIPFGNEITVEQLLDHTSGLHNFNGEDGRDFFADLLSDPRRGTRLWTAGELLAYAKKAEHKPTARPGEKRSYSSTGYIVLEMIIENVEGKPFPEVFREHLFGPLGMKSAGVEGADFGAGEIVDSYARPSGNDFANASPFAGRKAVRSDGLVNLSAGLDHYNAWARAAGAVAANIEDLARFMEAVEQGRFTVLRDQAAEFERARARTGKYFDWNGGSWGIQATVLFEPSRDLTVIVLTNASNSGPGSHDIAKSLLASARETPASASTSN
ncbi:MAG TPA: serine hydrolase domain-containing protein [Chthoniobacterales bacterium]|nr:serine hydrolase domain-containing protein [Chthoniobacterales bacterium]